MMNKQSWIGIGIGLAFLATAGALLLAGRTKKGARLLGLGRRSSCKSRFLFVGDSLTATDASFADQLRSVCPSIEHKKIAAVGKKTDWMLERLREELSKGKKYDVITIWGGVNDIYAGVPTATIKSNLQAMYNMADKTKAKVVAMTIIPTATYTKSSDAIIRKTNDINKWIRDNDKVDRIVDVNKALNDGRGGTRQEYLMSDTLHINPTGQRVIMKEYNRRIF